MRNICRKLFALSVLMGCVAHAQTQSRPAVVELFTSQGCSSCPAADAYIGELAQRPDVLTLAFHVDYWDDLGWRDRFSLGLSTDRQRAYSTAVGRSSVYTPQVVVDGQDAFVGTDRRRIDGALAVARTGVPVGISIDQQDVVVELSARANAVPSEVLLVPYLRKATSSIGRGENAGRKLNEFNIVRGLRELGHWKGDAASFRARLSSLPLDATDVAVLVQSRPERHVIGAVTLPLR
ncbi:MAG: DUF1223 domain-containing protein [Steroidobacteraceae bacterium]